MRACVAAKSALQIHRRGSRADARIMQERPRRETIDSVMAMLGLSCRREVEASLDSPRDELSLPCKQEVQNALSGFSHARRRRPLIYRIPTLRAGLGCGRGAARPRGNWDCQTPARHRCVLRRRGPRRRPGAFYSAATEGRGRLVEEKEESSAVEKEGLVDVFIACVRADPEKTCACVGMQRSSARLARFSCGSRTRAAAASRGVSK